MQSSGTRQISSLRFPLPLALALLLSACSSDYQGETCPATVSTLSGQSLGTTEGKVIDRFSSFSVTLPDLQVESGALLSSDRQLYVPSATTPDGWLAQRISEHRFSIINAPKDRNITFTCP